MDPCNHPRRRRLTSTTVAESDGEQEQRFRRRLAALVQRMDRSPTLLAAARRARELLPGDAEFGDSLSTAGSRQPHVLGRRLSAITAERPGVLRETGLSALQVWQALSEAQGRGRGTDEVTIVFTDLVDFSEWALEAGDDAAVRLLRCLDDVLEPTVRERGGEVVKRLGDGMMAVFDDAPAALEALMAIYRELPQVEAPGYEARLRAGIHVGRPRRLGGDYFGVDVNIAARLAECASPDEILVSDRAAENLDGDAVRMRRKRRLKVKGAPSDMSAFAVSPG
jgi:adenylate cyclase